MAAAEGDQDHAPVRPAVRHVEALEQLVREDIRKDAAEHGAVLGIDLAAVADDPRPRVVGGVVVRLDDRGRAQRDVFVRVLVREKFGDVGERCQLRRARRVGHAGRGIDGAVFAVHGDGGDVERIGAGGVQKGRERARPRPVQRLDELPVEREVVRRGHDRVDEHTPRRDAAVQLVFRHRFVGRIKNIGEQEDARRDDQDDQQQRDQHQRPIKPFFRLLKHSLPRL